MIPLVFANTRKSSLEVADSQGLGPLSDCISCTVTQSVDGQDEAQIVYPINGANYDLLQPGYLISVSREPDRPRQYYVIYRKTLGLDGTATLYAQHLSYRLRFMVVCSGRNSLDGLTLYFMTGQTINPDDVYGRGSVALVFDGVTPPSWFTFATPTTLIDAVAMIIEQTGSVVEYDNFSVIFHASRGEDNGVTVRYGGNLTDAQQEYDTGDGYNAVVPFWVNPSTGAVFPAGEDEFVVSQDLPSGQSRFPGQYLQKIAPLDLSDEFETQPSTSDLTSAAQAWLANNKPWEPFNSMTINFVPFDPDANANQAAAQNLRLYDYVRVVISPTDTDVTARVVKTVYNVLLDRYDSIEVGQLQTTLSDVYGRGSGGSSGSGGGSGGVETFDEPVQFNSSVAISAGKLLKSVLIEMVSATSIAAGGYLYGTYTIAQSEIGAGWTPIAIAGHIVNNRYVSVYNLRVRTDNPMQVTHGLYNTSTAARSTTLTVNVLCIRTSL